MQLDQARKIADYCAWDSHSKYLPHRELVIAAISAITLLAAGKQRDLTRQEMKTEAYRAIARETAKALAAHGKSRKGNAPRFAAYWNTRWQDHEDAVLERIAVWQVWDLLDSRTKNVLRAYCENITRDSRARQAGCSPESWNEILSRARAKARQRWFYPETDPGIYPYGRKRRWHEMAA